jgi:hypothetical protein
LDAPGFDAHRMTDQGWGRSFKNPIEVRRPQVADAAGDAGEYIAALPKKDHNAPEWRARRIAVAPPLCDGTGMENDRLFRFAVIAAGVVSAGAVAALVFLFY